jgi:programmed cell death protein 5
MTEEISEIKEKKMEEMRQKLLAKKQAEEKETQMEMQIESILRSAMSPEAKARLSNVKIVNKQLYQKAAQAIVYLFQSGKLQGKLQDNETRLLLEKLAGHKPEFKIVRKGNKTS